MRLYGAESDYYTSLDPPYEPRNGALKSIDELLQVAGVTADLLYGEDANRNGRLDFNENDGDASAPFDNSDGILQPGWAAFLTVTARELNQRADGTERTYINNGVLDELYDSLAEEFDEDIAQFVVAFRMYGVYVDPAAPGETAASEESDSLDLSSDSNSDSNTDSGNSRTSEGGLVEAAAAIGNALGGNAQGTVSRGGMDLSNGAKYDLESLYELIGAQVEAEVEGQEMLLQSPWAADPGSMQTYLPTLLDALTVVEGPELSGRINVNQARIEILLGIPDMTEDIAQAITSSSMIGAEGEAIAEQATMRTNTGWLVAQGIVDLPTMIKLDRFLTGRGHVFRAQIVGFFEEGGGYTRVEATIDATESPAKVVSVSDLTELGRGYTNTELTGIIDDGTN